MEDRLKELEEKVNELANKLGEQSQINTNLIKLIETVNPDAMENLSVHNLITRLKEINHKFKTPLCW